MSLPQTRAGLEELMDSLISRTNGLKYASFFEYERTRDIGVMGQELSRFLRQHGKLHSIMLSFLMMSTVKALPNL